MDFDALDRDAIRRIALQRLESLQRAGVTHLPKRNRPAAMTATEPPSSIQAPAGLVAALRAGSASAETLEPSVPQRFTGSSVSGQASSPYILEPQAMKPAAEKAVRKPNLFAQHEEVAPAMPASERPAALQVIAREVAGCVRCRELAATRKQTVFGVGDPNARLCFLGEAPGADEDQQGEPFVGRAGQLLNKIIEACTLRREDVYILNTLKCRPPGNRNPQTDELANCRGFLDRQLEIIRPEYICCLGTVAARALLCTEAPIGKLRKRFFDYHGIRVICTYHPAYLLRNPPAKKDVWEDMQLLMAEMGIKLPAAKK